MNLLIDIGNTHTSLALASPRNISPAVIFPTENWHSKDAGIRIQKFTKNVLIQNVFCCSVAPSITKVADKYFTEKQLRFDLLTSLNCGVEIDCPKPKSIGPDRLANAVAAINEFGSPVIVVDFGTAVTFDVINRKGAYVGGVITPGLSSMTDYLHEKTELLPRIKLRKPRRIIGKTTEEAMQIGTFYGYQGMIQGLLRQICQSLKSESVPVIATGGCAGLICKNVPEFTAIRPFLTLDGLRLALGKMN